ncbi:MAG TPA: NADH:flavin oxidoreductase/NADH oxidase [Candidatus Aquilonibacter sp.]|nr:NADH:flavin oxidoreductase/NADH oxidase [Candidatus Aquilonibacter sp.]
MSLLFSPITLRGMEFENRVVVSPMCQYSSIDGNANDWHVVNLGHYALSGPSLAFFEATAVSPEARITDRDLGLYSDANQDAMARVVAFMREWTKTKVGVQLAHAGRKASTLPPWEGGNAAHGDRAYQTVAPSAIPYLPDWHTPLALDDAGIEKVKRDFVEAARRCTALGIDVIELHFAHGYLGHQFLSPLTNHRDDRYGGTLENRMRFPLELFAAVREVWNDRPLGVRISATDWAEGGWDVSQSITLVNRLKESGCDFVDVSSGGLVAHQKITVGPGYQVPFAAEIKRATGVPTMSVGMITNPAQAETILRDGDADFIELARGFIRNPNWTWDAADALGGEPFVPPQYLRGRSKH